jgi:hypothetical protein
VGVVFLGKLSARVKMRAAIETASTKKKPTE